MKESNKLIKLETLKIKNKMKYKKLIKFMIKIVYKLIKK